MKETLVILTLAICGYSIASAQVKLGLKAGFNHANVEEIGFPSGLTSNPMYKTAFHAGLTLQNNLSEKLAIRTELLYSRKGYKVDSPGVSYDQFDLNYLSLPVLASFQFIPCLMLEAGPEIGYLVKAQGKIDNKKDEVDFLFENNWDLGLSGGLRFYPIKTLYLAGRYIHGFSNINDVNFTDENGEPLSPEAKTRNRAFQLSLGYEFNTKK